MVNLDSNVASSLPCGSLQYRPDLIKQAIHLEYIIALYFHSECCLVVTFIAVPVETRIRVDIAQVCSIVVSVLCIH